MKTRDLLSDTETDLVPKLKAMKIKELERHAQKILKKYGQPNYKGLLAAVIKVIPALDSSNGDEFTQIQAIVKTYLPSACNDDSDEQAILPRITVILMVIVTKKFKDIQGKKSP